MKYTVTYTLEVTDILDNEEVSEEWLADLDLKHLAEVSKEQLNVDDVLVSNYKYFCSRCCRSKMRGCIITSDATTDKEEA